MRRLLVLLLLVPLLLTGCWDRVEVNDVAIVSMVGIDKAPRGLRLSVNILIPLKASEQAGGEGDRGAVTYSAEGESVMNAMKKIQEQLSRRLFWAHTRVLVISEEYARGGIRPALDFWSRHREPRLLIKMAVTPGKAAEFLKAKPRFEKLLTEAVRESINLQPRVDFTLKEFLRQLRSKTEQPIAPRVTLVQHKDGQDALVSGTALFNGDRMIGWLSSHETRGLLWLRNEIANSVVTLDLPSGGRLSMFLVRASTQVRPYFHAGQLRVRMTFITEDDINESSAPVDLGNPEIAKLLEGFLRKEIEGRIRETLTKVQKEFRVDSFGLGDAVYRTFPRQWEGGLKERWTELFPQVPVELNVTAHIRRTGEHAAPLGIPDDQIKSDPKALLRPKE